MKPRPTRIVLFLCTALALALGACSKTGTGERFRSTAAATQSSAQQAAQHEEARRAFQYPERRQDGGA